MTKKHFVAFAKHIASYGMTFNDDPDVVNMRQAMAKMVIQVQDNPNFNKEKFLEACGLNKN